MTTLPPRVHRLARRLLGGRRRPVGVVARERRALRRALTGRPTGRVLVLGPGTATRQLLRGQAVDVAGTDPHAEDVTVCSAAEGAGSLPKARWDTVVVSDHGGDLGERLAAARWACRAGGRVVLLDRGRGAPDLQALGARVTAVPAGPGRPGLWIAEVEQ